MPTSGRWGAIGVRVAAWVCLAPMAGCGRAPADALARVPLEIPVADSIRAPQLSPDGPDGFLLSWLRPVPAGPGYAFEMARWRAGRWDSVRAVVRDDSVMMHPTDLPSITRLGNGSLAAVWQRLVNKPTNGDPWQYEIRVQFSGDDGRTWSAPLMPHPGSSLGGEHEFTAPWPSDDGRLGLVWIDPRDQEVIPGPDGKGREYTGAMMLMATTVDPDGSLGPEVVVDSTMCECCPNAVTVTPHGPIVAYRDKRIPDSIPRERYRYQLDVLRDLSLARLTAPPGEPARWRSGERITEDGWIYNGCPNNGPSLATRGDTVALAWWTGEGNRPRVQVRFSTDGGDRFGAPIRVDRDRGEGQVSVGLLDSAAIVGWLEGDSVRVRLVRPDGAVGPIASVGSAGGRHRLPRMIGMSDGTVVMGWLSRGGRLQLVRLERAGRSDS